MNQKQTHLFIIGVEMSTEQLYKTCDHRAKVNKPVNCIIDIQEHANHADSELLFFKIPDIT